MLPLKNLKYDAVLLIRVGGKKLKGTGETISENLKVIKDSDTKRKSKHYEEAVNGGFKGKRGKCCQELEEWRPFMQRLIV